jgi:hypothetical protein
MIFDPKPLGAFVEYSIRPLIQDSIELINLCDDKGIHPKDIISQSFKLFLVKLTFDLLTSIIVTGAICFTVLKVLSYRPILP